MCIYVFIHWYITYIYMHICIHTCICMLHIFCSQWRRVLFPFWKTYIYIYSYLSITVYIWKLHIYIYIHVYICIYTLIYFIHSYTYMYIFLYMYVTYILFAVEARVAPVLENIYIYIHTYLWLCIYENHTYIYIYTCVYMYSYIHILHIFICIYVYTHVYYVTYILFAVEARVAPVLENVHKLLDEWKHIPVALEFRYAKKMSLLISAREKLHSGRPRTCRFPNFSIGL